MKKKDIYVTQPYMPPLEEFLPYLREIWDSKWLTNDGPFHRKLEMALQDYLGVEHIALFCNGTIALVAALQALRIGGEVITTPYSFVATAHSLLWNGIKPVFVDIDRHTFNMDPKKIEAAITPKTTAILPVHVYGNPCDVDAIERIADTYGLKVIYDAAHAFGVRREDKSILNYGDLSVLSFHATKVFNTFEGGAIVCPDAKMKQRIDFLKNFGFADEVTVVAPGINGKMNELQAAYGLLQLEYIDQAISKRKYVDNTYRKLLTNVAGISCPNISQAVEHNYSYFPILVEPDFRMSRDELYSLLKSRGFFPRRYFYPLISNFPMYRGLDSSSQSNLSVAHEISSKILCLPIFPDLDIESIESICELIRQ